jgi:hypothetical protein
VPPSPPVSPQTPQATQPQQQHLSLLDQLLEPPQQQQQQQQQQQSLQQQLLQQQQWQQTSAEAQQVQQPLLQGCTRLKLQLPLPVASAAPPGERSSRPAERQTDFQVSHLFVLTTMSPVQKL